MKVSVKQFASMNFKYIGDIFKLIPWIIKDPKGNIIGKRFRAEDAEAVTKAILKKVLGSAFKPELDVIMLTSPKIVKDIIETYLLTLNLEKSIEHKTLPNNCNSILDVYKDGEYTIIHGHSEYGNAIYIIR